MDPCGAVQVRVTLEPSQEQTVIGLLGEAADDASVLIARAAQSCAAGNHCRL